MSDAWAEIQALKSKRESRRIRLEERKKERQDILNRGLVVGGDNAGSPTSSPRIKVDPGAAGSSDTKIIGATIQVGSVSEPLPTTPLSAVSVEGLKFQIPDKVKSETGETEHFIDGSFEDYVLQTLSDVALRLPMDSKQLLTTVNRALDAPVTHEQIFNLLQKFAVQQLISIEEKLSDGGSYLEIITADHTKLLAMLPSKRKRKDEDSDSDVSGDGIPEEKRPKEDENDVLSLLSLASTREKENKRLGEEILELLSRPSVKEKTLAERFRSQGGSTVKEFCPHGTKTECCRVSASSAKPCGRLHFRKIIQSHTDESLGDCSFLNTCFHMETCKYVHYEVDSEDRAASAAATAAANAGNSDNRLPLLPPKGVANTLEAQTAPTTVLNPPQWIQCDLRFFDMTILGKFSVIMADPPWDIHMELPYGTLSDDEMRQLNIPALQDEGLIFLWVTGRAMELGRECLELWGYERVDELIWVKTNQLQRIIRTGRTGHWLNHGKEHCLVGMKGNPPVNRGLDCDVIVAEVRATSHKPDEIYGIIERLSPGTRKIELFGRPHNIQPNWITLGNQLSGTHIVEDDISTGILTRYPDGNFGAKPGNASAK